MQRNVTTRPLVVTLWIALAAPGCGPNASEVADGGDVTLDAASADFDSADAPLDSNAATDAGATSTHDIGAGHCTSTPALLGTAAPDANLHIVVDAQSGACGGFLVVALVPADVVAKGGFHDPAEVELHNGLVPSLPVELKRKVAPGQWVIRAELLAGPGEEAEPLSAGIGCKDKDVHPVVTSAGGAVAKTQVAMAPIMGSPSPALLCFAAVKAKPGLLTTKAEVEPEAGQETAPHYIAGLRPKDRLWVAGWGDGVVSFDFPSDKPPQPLQGWKVHGKPDCHRLHRVGDELFCASRKSYIHVLRFEPDSMAKLSIASVDFGPDVHTAGMADAFGLLYVAAHSKGLVALDLSAGPPVEGQDDPPYGSKYLSLPPGLTDTWDVVKMGDDRLLLADGSAGLKLLDLKGAGGTSPLQVAHMPLSGVAAFLDVDKKFVAVGAVSGGLHLVHVDKWGKFKLMGSLPTNHPVYGVALHDTWLFAANGASVLTVRRPTDWPNKPLGLERVAITPSPRYVMDVVPQGDRLLTTEFEVVRQLLIGEEPPPAPALEARDTWPSPWPSPAAP